MIEFGKANSGGGDFFDAKNYSAYEVLLIEVKDFERDVPTPKYGRKDTGYIDVAAFKTAADLAAGKAEVAQNVVVQQTALAKTCGRLVGKAAIVKLNQIPTDKGNPAWVFDDIEDAAVQEQVVAYVKQREEAIAKAVAAAPGF